VTTLTDYFSNNTYAGFIQHTLGYLSKKWGAMGGMYKIRTVDTAVRFILMCAWQIMKQHFLRQLLRDPNFKPKFLIELVHSGVNYDIAKTAERKLQALLGEGEPDGRLFLNRVDGGHVPRNDESGGRAGGTATPDGYDVLVVFVERQDFFGEDPLVSSHAACSGHAHSNARQRVHTCA
jgi:hypothetical protein